MILSSGIIMGQPMFALFYKKGEIIAQLWNEQSVYCPALLNAA